MDSRLAQLLSALDAAHEDYDQLCYRVAKLETKMFKSMANRKRYIDNVRQCCAEFLYDRMYEWQM